jgi:hypothetical protein
VKEPPVGEPAQATVVPFPQIVAVGVVLLIADWLYVNTVDVPGHAGAIAEG